jgi:hypothetical protein
LQLHSQKLLLARCWAWDCCCDWLN